MMKVQSLDPLVQTHRLDNRVHSQAGADNRWEKAYFEKEQERERTNEREHFSRDVLEKAVEQANETMLIYNRGLSFQLHEESGQWMVSVINKDTDEVIREIPPEWLLDMVAHFKDMVGIMVDEIV
ncbi:flagellar protein FlaG [Desulfofalx alkaliphila]|uniref:flagellar protein FlaG n=1 Tax=Desulfofalx alkaliphila TaxID=105483 RepID=UPI00068D7203|nr:flagellar protein FlaG [Desulfofalx alkaliphila]